MNTVARVARRMIEFPHSTLHDAEHLLKVWGWARLIGLAEEIDPQTLETLEIASLVHDIACPQLRREHGSAPGHLQEALGPGLARALLEELGLPAGQIDRVAQLVGRHHTIANVDGLDHRILLEADFLVNAGEQRMGPRAIRTARERVFATPTGRALLDALYLQGDSAPQVRIRPARREDLPRVAAIYEAIHDREARGLGVTGWIRGVYPTEATAREALLADDLYVLEEDGVPAGAARINRVQVPAYAQARWSLPAEPERVMVLHTLVIDPARAGRGLATRFVKFYEDLARERGCDVLRLDTNARNAAARRLYARLGYREADIVPCAFNGIPDVELVCLEKGLE